MIQACILAISSQLPFQDEKILIISINSLSKLVNRLSQENLMAYLSTFLPAVLDAFENHSPYVRKFLYRPGKADEHCVLLELGCRCTTPVLGQAGHPSSDTARAGAAWSGGQTRQQGASRWVGPAGGQRAA